MRPIKLRGFNTVSLSADPKELLAGGTLTSDGRRQVSLGRVGGEHYRALEIARLNQATVIWSTICIEHLMDRIITNYLFGTAAQPTEQQNFFEAEVITASFMQFSFKKELIRKIVERELFLSGKERSKLQGYLKKVMTWRNAFAHGSFLLDSQRGILLRYYSGGHQEQELGDDFWDSIESTYNECYVLAERLAEMATEHPVA